MNTLKLLAVASIATVFLMASEAFADNPYYGGYAKNTSVEELKQIWGTTDFNDSDPSVTTGGVISTSGIDSSGDSSGTLYQNPLTLQTDDDVVADPQVWSFDNLDLPEWQDVVPLGTHGTASSDVDYVYTTFYWDSGRTQVTFYYEPHFNDGTSTFDDDSVYQIETWDNSQNFGVGFVDFNDHRAKLLQFGVESQGSEASGWNITQKDMGFVSVTSGVNSLKDIDAFTSPYTPSDPTNHSYITYQIDGSTVSLNAVGQAQYDVDADYPLEGTGVPDGNVEWFNGSFLTPGTQLWT